MDEYPLVEEKLVDGIPAPNEKPLDEELLEVGNVMHADIAIAPRLHKIIAAIRAIRLMRSIIFPLRGFANRAQIGLAAACPEGLRAVICSNSDISDDLGVEGVSSDAPLAEPPNVNRFAPKGG